MDEIKMFLANNYIWFLVASGILLISLIGCLIDYNKKKKEAQKLESVETLTVNEVVEQLDMSVPQNTTEPAMVENVSQAQASDISVGNPVQESVDTLNDTNN